MMSKNSNKKASSRIIPLHVIRVIAMLMVLVLHTIISFTMRPDFFATKLWFIVEPISAISKPAVLLFFMLSGYLVITKNRTISENWQKTKKRILVPLLFFSVINLIYQASVFHFTNTNALLFWLKQLVRVTNFPSSPLWFLVVLLFMYILNPIWQIIFSDEKNRNTARYLVALALLYPAFVTIIKYPSMKNDIFYNNFTAWIGFTFFYLYGGLVRKNWVQIANRKINWIVMVLSLITIMIGDFFSAHAHLHSYSFIWNGYTFDYLSIPVMALSISIFNLIVSAEFEHLRHSWQKIGMRLLLFFAPFSYGIYLVHTYVISIFTDKIGFTFDKLHINVYLYNILNYSLVLGISLLITIIIRKIPVVKAVIGE